MFVFWDGIYPYVRGTVTVEPSGLETMAIDIFREPLLPAGSKRSGTDDDANVGNVEEEESNLSTLELMNREKVSDVEETFQRMHGRLQRHHHASRAALASRVGSTRLGGGLGGMTVGSIGGVRYEGKEGGLRQRRKHDAAEEERKRDRAAGLQIHKTIGGSAKVSLLDPVRKTRKLYIVALTYPLRIYAYILSFRSSTIASKSEATPLPAR